MGDVYAYEITGPGTDLFGIIDLTTGVFTSLGSLGLTSAGLGSFNGALYAAADHGNTLYSINTSTGALTAVGTGNLSYGDFGSTTSGLYAFGDNGDLYSINPANGAATDIGPTGVSFGGVVMGMSSGSSALYLTEGDSLYTLNTTTGAATLIGTVPEYGFGALVSIGGTLYGGAYETNETPHIYTIDPQTAVATILSASPLTPSSPGVPGFWGLAPGAPPPPPPPPGTLFNGFEGIGPYSTPLTLPQGATYATYPYNTDYSEGGITVRDVISGGTNVDPAVYLNLTGPWYGVGNYNWYTAANGYTDIRLTSGAQFQTIQFLEGSGIGAVSANRTVGYELLNHGVVVATGTIPDHTDDTNTGYQSVTFSGGGFDEVRIQGNDRLTAFDPNFFDVLAIDSITATSQPPTSTVTQTLLNDTGVSHTDLITSDGHVTVTGLASQQMNSVQIWNAVTNTQVGNAGIAGDGKSWTFSTNLPEGSYQLYAKLADVSGIVGQTTPEPTIVVDKTPPVSVMLDAIFNSATNLTTLTGTSEANSSVSVYDGTKLIGTITAAADGTWSLPANVATKGIHSFTEKSTDLAGNTGASPGVTLYSQLDHQSLQGGSGNDVLIAAPKDTLTGGGGSDTFVFNPNFGKDTIKDFNVNQDVIAFAHSLFPNGVTQVLSQAHDTKAGAAIVVDANDAVTLTGVTVAQLQSHASDIHFV